jgi:hypothetical protein
MRIFHTDNVKIKFINTYNILKFLVHRKYPMPDKMVEMIRVKNTTSKTSVVRVKGRGQENK